jgi:hypothetical protein
VTSPVSSDASTHASVGLVLYQLVRHPVRNLWWKWNWKSAVLSSVFRAVLFFLTNLSAGTNAAVGAMVAEFLFRAATAGFYGALTQAFRFAQPRWAAALAAMVLLPFVTHTLEFLVHYVRGTPNLALSIGASALFTALSTVFNLFAMRRGALIVGHDRQSLWDDVKSLPGLYLAFAVEAGRLAVGLLRAIARGIIAAAIAVVQRATAR